MITATSIYLIIKWAGAGFCLGHIIRGIDEKERNEVIVIEVE